MHGDALPPLLRYLQETRPQTVLVLGREAEPVARAYRATHADANIVIAMPAGVAEPMRYDAAILAGCIEHLEKTQALALIARLRDMQAARLLVAAPLGLNWTGHASYWDEYEFLALGMQVYARLACEAGPMLFYRYDIHDYKPVPDWLNSQYWAHPERWQL